MRYIYTTLKVAAVSLILVGAQAFAQPNVGPNIVEVAQSYSQLSSLVTALGETDLAAQLTGPGPFTVFAPTNRAFANVPVATLEAIVSDPATLRAVLAYHVVGGPLVASNIAEGRAATTLLGEDVRFASTDQGLSVGGAQVAASDILASNGVVHIIDRVLLPPSLFQGRPEALDNIVEIVQTEPQFSTLATALEAAGMINTLRVGSEYTLFAPTNAAFERLPRAQFDALLADPAALRAVLSYHVLVGQATEADLVNINRANTLEGSEVLVTVSGGNIVINDTPITLLNLITTNGVIQVVDEVLIPSGM